ncbi:MAG: hypothetical protein K9J81_03035 [Desulfohalobiaceae bacterium]|nr:hypothetical protein [Desulfohalobiaceae bacterium]
MLGFWKKLETLALAVAFAEAGEHEQARLYLKTTGEQASRHAPLNKKRKQPVNQAQQDLRL